MRSFNGDIYQFFDPTVMFIICFYVTIAVLTLGFLEVVFVLRNLERNELPSTVIRLISAKDKKAIIEDKLQARITLI